MQLVSYRRRGVDSFGVLKEGGCIIDLPQSSDSRIGSLRRWLAAGELDHAAQIAALTPNLRLEDVELLPVIPNATHYWCLALNYGEHAKEVQRDRPEHPALFMRYADSLTGHDRPLILPKVSKSLDWEGELAVIIGRGGRYIAEADAMKHVAGYSIFNDGSVRDWQFHTRQIAPGKNFFSTGALGPSMVTSDEVPHPDALAITTRVNGEVMQRGSTADMIFSIAKFISYVSSVLPLVPGDVLATGTPSGVGWSRKPPLFLRSGDVCEVEISGIGVLRNTIVAE